MTQTLEHETTDRRDGIGEGHYSEIERLLRIMDKANGTERYDLVDYISSRLDEIPLSVLVRSGWHNPGDDTAGEPVEYEILLSTGGPAVRIYGELGIHNEPQTAELQVQDWFKPWTPANFEYSEGTLLQFAQQFYYGD